jgi:SAM-dependent methyltransferase
MLNHSFHMKKGKNLKIIREFILTFFKKKNIGYCCICESKTLFIEKTKWLRENYKCIKCGSSPRQRTLINALNVFVPGWKELTIHESSPSTVSSAYIKLQSANYSASHFFPDIPIGSYFNGFRCEDLSRMTFNQESIDLFITQDVFEHVIEPIDAFREIARVLKPGGAHVFTLGWSPGTLRSEPRSIMHNGGIKHLKEPLYHGNPIDDKGSLVTWNWGIDLPDIIFQASELTTTIFSLHDRKRGLDGETIDVFISRKSK